jgi:zinc transport system substrate-binding protein
MLLLPMTGCTQEQTAAQEKLRIVATVFPQYDFARTIAGEYADVTLLLSAGQEMHNYEPSPLDVAEIAGCDIFLRIGGESEVWTDTVLEALDTSHMDVVTLMDAIETPLAEEDEAEEFDEHIWTSPINAIAMAEAVCDSLCRADPEHTEIFTERTEEYTAALSALDTEYRTLAEGLDNPVLVIADKFPFRYLAAEYGFQYAAAFSGCSSETEPTVASLAELTAVIQENRLNTVFYLQFSSSRIAERVCAMTGAKAAMLHPCHNVSAEEMEQGVTFLELMQENYEAIKEALT